MEANYFTMGFPGGSEVKASACNAGDLGSIPGLGRSPGEGNGNPLQYSCLENPMDGAAWWATVHGVTKSWTRLSDFTTLQYCVDFCHTLTCIRRRQWHPTPVLLPGKSHGWRSLVSCSPWGREESDTTEWLPFHFSLPCIGKGNGSPLQCFCLENLRDGGAWWAAIYGVTQSRTRLKWLSSSSSRHASAMGVHVSPILNPPSTSLLIPSNEVDKMSLLYRVK